ncbi:MAG: hypothetical protein ACP6IP_06700 [Candidatus Njordarchaeia archaeon]
MQQEKWADLMSNLMKIAEDLFSSVKDFKRGKLVAEVEAEVAVRIEIARDKEGRVNATLGILPKEELETTEEEKKETEEAPKTVEPAGEPSSGDLELKEEIEVLDVEEKFDEENRML